MTVPVPIIAVPAAGRILSAGGTNFCFLLMSRIIAKNREIQCVLWTSRLLMSDFQSEIVFLDVFEVSVGVDLEFSGSEFVANDDAVLMCLES